MNKEKVTIIGAGLSGLSAGIRLLQQNIPVQIYEARPNIGGVCSTDTINGFTFNNGALYIALPQLLDTAFTQLGINRQTALPLIPIQTPQTTTLPSGTQITFGPQGKVQITGHDAQRRTTQFQNELDHCRQKWSPLLKLFIDHILPHPYSLPLILRKAWRHLPKLRGTLATELNHLFSDPETRAAVAAITLYTGLPAEHTPIFQIIGIVAMLEQGFFLPPTGMGAITQQLQQRFQQLGGQIHTNTPIQHIHLQNNRIHSLQPHNQTPIQTNTIISTLNALATFKTLLNPTDIPTSINKRLARAPLSHTSLCIQLGLANHIHTPAFAVNHLPLMPQQHQFLTPQPSPHRWLSYTVPTHTLPQLATNGGSIIEMFTAVDPNQLLEHWDTNTAQTHTETAIAALREHHQLDILTQRITSPQDYANRLHLYQGALYGLSPAASPAQQFPYKTPINGLYLAGQTTYPGFGVAPAILSGIHAANALL